MSSYSNFQIYKIPFLGLLNAVFDLFFLFLFLAFQALFAPTSRFTKSRFSFGELFSKFWFGFCKFYSLPPSSLPLPQTHTPTHRATTRQTSSECQSAGIRTCVSGGSNQVSLKVADCVVIKELTGDDGLTRFSMSPSAVWRKPRRWGRAWDNTEETLLSLTLVREMT